ncbi:hypothetical protein [Flavobacterium sp. JP2137]|uniref:hypothetical protein n=1 Tax=Flavobacterium sp. JP2137 TaxID=3414510 RepID=UPI003D2FBC14
MNKVLKIIIFLFPIILFGQGMEIKDTPKEYVDHIVNIWEVDSSKIVYISKETSLFKLASVFHESVLAFVAGNLSTSAEILDGRRKWNKKVCGLALNNLDIENVKKHLRKGHDYSKIRFKRVADGTEFNFNNENMTTVLIYSKKLDYVIGDYFKVLKGFSDKGMDYVIITMDNEILSQIPTALSQAENVSL